jgi:hypothetical protein
MWYFGNREVNYFICWIVMLYAAKSGALFPDVDHHWESVKEKTTINRIINTVIHLTGGKHRSWQTHSWDIAIVYMALAIFLPNKLQQIGLLDNVNSTILSLLMIGFGVGWVSHLFSDMLTSAGVRVWCFRDKKIAFVPKQIFNFRFNTGHEWEGFVYNLTKKFNILVGIGCVIFPFLFVS